jgi:hypothetical protein
VPLAGCDRDVSLTHGPHWCVSVIDGVHSRGLLLWQGTKSAKHGAAAGGRGSLQGQDTDCGGYRRGCRRAEVRGHRPKGKEHGSDSVVLRGHGRRQCNGAAASGAGVNVADTLTEAAMHGPSDTSAACMPPLRRCIGCLKLLCS